jgi:hypothetical protein
MTGPKDDSVVGRFAEFCAEYEIPKKHHGSLRMLAHMAFVLGYEIELRLHPREKQEREDV